MIQYGSYLHKSRVIVFVFSDSSLVQINDLLRYHFCCQFLAKLNDLRAVELDKKETLKATT